MCSLLLFPDSRVSKEELEFGPMVGSGSFGNVYKGRWKGTTVALKCIKLPPGSDMSSLPAPVEVEVLRLVVQHNSVKCHTVLLFIGA